MFFCHWMLNRADFYFYSVSLNFKDRNMLFHRSVNCSREKFCHSLSTAHRIHTRIFYHQNKVSAMFTNVKFHFFLLVSLKNKKSKGSSRSNRFASNQFDIFFISNIVRKIKKGNFFWKKVCSVAVVNSKKVCSEKIVCISLNCLAGVYQVLRLFSFYHWLQQTFLRFFNRVLYYIRTYMHVLLHSFYFADKNSAFSLRYNFSWWSLSNIFLSTLDLKPIILYYLKISVKYCMLWLRFELTFRATGQVQWGKNEKGNSSWV